jgi:peptidoglycan/LPS O-acetylase OafA/YrhL
VIRPDGVGHTSDDLLNLFWLNLVKFNPLVRLPEFLLGACCGALYLRGAFHRSWTARLTIGGIAAFLAIAYASPYIPYPILHDGLLAPAFAALIVGLALRPAWMRWMEAQPLILLGNASYSFYLLHSFVFGAYFSPKGELKPYGFAGYMIGLLLPVAIALLVYRFIEEPARRKLRPKASPGVNTSKVVAQSA